MITSKEIRPEEQHDAAADLSALGAALLEGKELVRKHFRSHSNLHIEKITDPESGELFSEIVFEVSSQNQDLMSAYDALTSEWVESHPATVRAHIRFVFAVI